MIMFRRVSNRPENLLSPNVSSSSWLLSLSNNEILPSFQLIGSTLFFSGQFCSDYRFYFVLKLFLSLCCSVILVFECFIEFSGQWNTSSYFQQRLFRFFIIGSCTVFSLSGEECVCVSKILIIEFHSAEIELVIELRRWSAFYCFESRLGDTKHQTHAYIHRKRER